jgi:PIN domain nuclease of toxin-antitoxin system
MRLLVDTQCWLWMTAAPERFAPSIRAEIENPDTELFLSAASAWEIAVKHALGKLQLPTTPSDYVTTRLASVRARPLPISIDHALRAAELPPRHRDPFDRLLVAQAQIERLAILTADRSFSFYDVEVINPA